MTLTMLIASCSAVLDVDEPQCTNDAKCVERFARGWTCTEQQVCVPPSAEDSGMGPGLPERWQCLQDEPKAVQPMPTEKITVRFSTVDYESLLTPEGLRARACNITDVNCNRPLQQDVTVGADGYLEFEVTKGFPGYFELEAPDMLTNVFYTNRPYEDDIEFSGPVMVNSETVVDLSARGDIAADLSKGLVVFLFFDCLGNAGPGVSLTRNSGEEGEVFYFDGGLPNRDLTMSRLSNALSATGQPLAAAGITNIAPGFENFTVVHEESGLELGTYTAEIRPGTMTTVFMYAGY